VTESSLLLNTAILSELTAPTSESIHISTILLESRRFGVIEMQEKNPDDLDSTPKPDRGAYSAAANPSW